MKKHKTVAEMEEQVRTWPVVTLLSPGGLFPPLEVKVVHNPGTDELSINEVYEKFMTTPVSSCPAR